MPPSCLDVQEAWAITLFIERTLLPAINRMPADRAPASWTPSTQS